MVKIKKVIFLTIIQCLFITSVWAQENQEDLLSYSGLWKAEREWNKEEVENYRLWAMKSFQKEIFYDEKSPYAGIVGDCADLFYAFWVIYSYERKLPLRISTPYRWEQRFQQNKAVPFYYQDKRYLFKEAYFSEKTAIFDSLPQGLPRVKALIETLVKIKGTWELSHRDTLPVALNDIQPGDLYLYRIVKREQKKSVVSRHTYVIKNILDDGRFVLIYSTQARRDNSKKRGTLLGEKEGFPEYYPWQAPWGFRRFKLPHEYTEEGDTIKALIPAQVNANVIASQLGDEKYKSLKGDKDIKFFKIVEMYTRKVEEKPLKEAQDLIIQLCAQLKERDEVVVSGVDFAKANKGKCMNEEEYDIYPTPTRDSGLKKTFDTIQEKWEKAQMLGLSDPYLKLLFSNDPSEIQEEKIKELSPCFHTLLKKVDEVDKIYPHELYERFKEGKISSHPNTSYSARWGLVRGRTSCKAYY